MDSIHALLKGPVMNRAFEETKHFPMEHSWQGEGMSKYMATCWVLSRICVIALEGRWFCQFHPVVQNQTTAVFFFFFLFSWAEDGDSLERELSPCAILTLTESAHQVSVMFICGLFYR